MSDATALPVGLIAPASAPRVIPQKVRDTAQAFEASFLSQMLKPMFEGLSTEAPFGGGEAEATWRGFLVDEMAKQTARVGGVGLADRVVAEMLKMQEQGAAQ